MGPPLVRISLVPLTLSVDHPNPVDLNGHPSTPSNTYQEKNPESEKLARIAGIHIDQCHPTGPVKIGGRDDRLDDAMRPPDSGSIVGSRSWMMASLGYGINGDIRECR